MGVKGTQVGTARDLLSSLTTSYQLPRRKQSLALLLGLDISVGDIGPRVLELSPPWSWYWPSGSQQVKRSRGPFLLVILILTWLWKRPRENTQVHPGARDQADLGLWRASAQPKDAVPLDLNKKGAGTAEGPDLPTAKETVVCVWIPVL